MTRATTAPSSSPPTGPAAPPTRRPTARAGKRRSLDERGVEELAHVRQTLGQHLGREWVAVEQAAEERRVAEVAQQGPVPGHEQLLGIVGAERPGGHLPT